MKLKKSIIGIKKSNMDHILLNRCTSSNQNLLWSLMRNPSVLFSHGLHGFQPSTDQWPYKLMFCIVYKKASGRVEK